MKKLTQCVIGLVLGCVLLTGCQTTAPTKVVDNRPRFNESTSTDVILQFNRWDTIHVLRPESRENGFLPIWNRTDVERELQAKRVGHNLAVVVLGFLFPGDIEAKYAREWDAFLSAQGFKRVVVLRCAKGSSIDGLLIVHDSSIAGAHEEKAVAAAQTTSLPSSAGANVANPPGN